MEESPSGNTLPASVVIEFLFVCLDYLYSRFNNYCDEKIYWARVFKDVSPQTCTFFRHTLMPTLFFCIGGSKVIPPR